MGTKRILHLSICLLTVTAITAKNGLKLKSGDASVLGKDARAFVVFDYSKTEIEGKDMTLEDYIDQKGYKFESKWETAQTMSHRDFIKHFNKKSNGIRLSADSTGKEDYKMIIHIRTINLGNTVKSLLPKGEKTDGGVSLSGRIIIKDKSKANICALSFADIQGQGTSSIEVRMLYAYQALRSAIICYMKKSAVKKETEQEEDDDTGISEEDDNEDTSEKDNY